MDNIPTGSVDMILCDLPYGITNCRWDSVLPFDRMWEQYHRVAKPHAAIVLFACGMFAHDLIASNKAEFKYKWYWIKNNKTGAPNAKRQPMRQVEEILVFYRKFGIYNPQGVKDCHIIKGASPKPEDTVYHIRHKPHLQTKTGYPANVLHYSKDAHCVHPTQKPLALCEYLIRTYTNPGDTVLDSCMGSGTTGVAALACGRDFIGCEMNDKYFQLAAERIKREMIM